MNHSIEAPKNSVYMFGSIITNVKFKNRNFMDFPNVYDTTDTKLASLGGVEQSVLVGT